MDRDLELLRDVFLRTPQGEDMYISSGIRQENGYNVFTVTRRLTEDETWGVDEDINYKVSFKMEEI